MTSHSASSSAWRSASWAAAARSSPSPALVYVVGLNPERGHGLADHRRDQAPRSAPFHRRRNPLNWRVACSSAASAWSRPSCRRALRPRLPRHAARAILAAHAGGRRLDDRQPKSQRLDAPPRLGCHAASGAGVGASPAFWAWAAASSSCAALVMLVGLPIQQAVATSLVVIAMNSLAGLLGHLSLAALDYGVIALFVVSGFAGIRGRTPGLLHPPGATAHRLRRLCRGARPLLFIDNVGNLL